MDLVFSILKDYSPVFIGILLILILLLLIISIVNASTISKLKRKYKKLTRGIQNKNLEELFLQNMDKIDYEISDIQKSRNEIKQIIKAQELCIQKTGFIRYNPFQEVGGDLSFSIALLNGLNSGIVITSLYSRSGSAVFSKKIENGECKSPLSDEEKVAINNAINIEAE